MEKDMRSHFPAARDQGARATCLACATSDAHAAKATNHTALSVEFAFYHATKIDGGDPSDGVSFAAIDQALYKHGQPYENDWPYQLIEPDITTWAPPPSIGKTFHTRCPSLGNNVGAVFQHMDQSKPVIIGIEIGSHFFKLPADSVLDFDPREPVIGYHAVLAIGWGRDPKLGSARALLVRNSWGPGWGIGGHAWLTETYISQRLFEYSIVT